MNCFGLHDSVHGGESSAPRSSGRSTWPARAAGGQLPSERRHKKAGRRLCGGGHKGITSTAGRLFSYS